LSLKFPLEFAKSIGPHRHIVLFYEEIEYARTVTFKFIKVGIERKEHSFYIHAKGVKEFLENEFKETMYGPNWCFNMNS
jgi:hypothetical protein